jgi:CheY-like chemotaxis protein/Flp pilus assembly protein TadD
MNLADSGLKQLDNPSLTQNERVLLRCRLASEFIHTGQYESAREALGELWQGVGERPNVEKLKPFTAAEVLLQCGALSSWLGNSEHLSGAQEKAKDLLFEALRMFKAQGQPAKVSEAQYVLGICYFWLGAYDEARVVLDEALSGLNEEDFYLRAKILIRRSIIEIWTGRYHDAWNVLEKAKEFFEASGDALKGKWHGQKGLVLQRLALTEKRTDYADRAIIEFTAATYHCEQAGNERYCGIAFNNLAMLLYQLERYSEAHEYLDRAKEILKRYEDVGTLAQVNDTRARVFVAEQRYEEADRIITSVIQAFEQSGDQALLVDAFTLQGLVWARLGVKESSIQILNRAISVAQESGSYVNGGLAALTLIEEHGESLNENKLYRIYCRADELLKDVQDAEHITRLRACARIVTKRLLGAQLSDNNFSIANTLDAYEARFIAEALELERGSITRAAKRLGMSHQLLGNALKTRHSNLIDLRTTPKPRRRSIIHNSARQHRNKKQERPVTILHVEDSRMVATAVRDTLQREGWKVITSEDGSAGLRLIMGKEHYDVLLVDYDLPFVNGLSLVRRARQLPHRQRTPIIMLSATNCEREAIEVGVDAFLRKPEDVLKLAETISRLLAARHEKQ